MWEAEVETVPLWGQTIEINIPSVVSKELMKKIFIGENCSVEFTQWPPW